MNNRIVGVLVLLVIGLMSLGLFSLPTAVHASDCRLRDLTWYPPSGSELVVVVVNHGGTGPCPVTAAVYDMHGMKDVADSPQDLYTSEYATVKPYSEERISFTRSYNTQCMVQIHVMLGHVNPRLVLTPSNNYTVDETITSSSTRGHMPCPVLASASTPSPSSSTPIPVSMTSSTKTAVLPEKTQAPLPPNTGTNRLSKKGNNQKIVFGAGAMTLAGALAALSYKRRIR